MGRPLILITNDDGVAARGLVALREALAPLAEVVTVAPDAQRSAVGHSITLRSSLRVWRHDSFNGFVVYACSGTPADCATVGIHASLWRRPDLVVSGINDGANMGEDLTYSGTVCAAMEAAIQGVPAIAISAAPHPETGETAYVAAGLVSRALVKLMLSGRLPEVITRATGCAFLNVNVPSLPPGEIRGVAITRPGIRCYDLNFHRTDISETEILLEMTGGPVDFAEQPGTDVAAVAEGRISITPVTHDIAAPASLLNGAQWDLGEVLHTLKPGS